MLKICSNCKWWLLYQNVLDRCKCDLHSIGFREVYTLGNDTCNGWQKKQEFKNFRKAIEKHHKEYPKIEDLY